MPHICSCKDWKHIIERQYDVIQYNEKYNKWLITWLCLSKKDKKHFSHRYGLVIKYCPFCGKELKCNFEQ